MMENLLPFGFHDDGLPEEGIIDIAATDPFDMHGYVSSGNFDQY